MPKQRILEHLDLVKKVHQQGPIYLLQQVGRPLHIAWIDPSCFVCLGDYNLWDENFDGLDVGPLYTLTRNQEQSPSCQQSMTLAPH